MNTPASQTEFFDALLAYMRPKYPVIAGTLDFNPSRFLPAIDRIRELCEKRGITETQAQLPYVVANLFA